MSRWILVIIPLVTCSVVLVAVFVVGSPRPQPAALLYGGPTAADSPLAWTLEVERVGAGESPPYDGPIVVEVTMPDGSSSTLRRSTNGGRADMVFRPKCDEIDSIPEC